MITGGQDRLTIDASGNAAFTGEVSSLIENSGKSSGVSLKAEPSSGTAIIYADCGGGVTQAALKIQDATLARLLTFLALKRLPATRRSLAR